MKTKTYMLTFVALVYLPMHLFAQYYKDLNADIAQTPSSFSSGVSSIQSAFNNARTKENQQLSTSLPQLTFPGNWASMNVQQRATWIINKERVDRGLKAFTGTDTNVVSIAQYYADYLLKNDKFGHNEDGLTPSTRLNKNSTVAACHEFTYSIENLSVAVSSSTADIPYEMESAVYNWLYADASSAWGHRRCLLQTSFNDNSGKPGEEGLFGIGVASGGPYKGPFSQSWNHAELVVFEVIDPCASWKYDNPTAIAGLNKENTYHVYHDGNNIHVTLPSPADEIKVGVYNMLGAKVHEQRCGSGQSTIKLPGPLTPGIYIVTVTGETYSGSRRIMVK